MTDPGLIELEKQFTEALGTRVQIAKTDFGGKVVIDYFSPEDLENLFRMIAQSGIRVSHPELDMGVAAPDAVAAPEVTPEASPEEAIPEPEKPIDDRPLADKKEDDETDLYAIKNFSL